MNMVKLLLRSAIPITLLFSANSYAIPILQLHGIGAATGDIYFAKYNDSSMSRSANNELYRVYPLIWNGDADQNTLSGSSRGFNSLYGLYSAFASPLLDPDLMRFAILDPAITDVNEENHDIGSGEDTNSITGFLATLGIAADWPLTDEHSRGISEQGGLTPTPDIPLTTRRGPRGECQQQAQKPGLREDLCLDASGLAGTGSRGGIGAIAGRGVSSVASPGAGVGSGGAPGAGGALGANPGVGGVGSNGSGSPSAGGGAPGSNPGGGGVSPAGSPGVDGTGPGSGAIGGEINIGGDEVRLLPEPPVLALLGFGLVCMYAVRQHKKQSPHKKFYGSFAPSASGECT
jgi:hypothetical protein